MESYWTECSLQPLASYVSESQSFWPAVLKDKHHFQVSPFPNSRALKLFDNTHLKTPTALPQDSLTMQLLRKEEYTHPSFDGKKQLYYEVHPLRTHWVPDKCSKKMQGVDKFRSLAKSHM